MRKRSGRPPRFAQVPNESVDDSLNLDLTALGLLTVFLRHRDGWDITLADVGRKYGYGEDAMANAMGMLQVARYVVKVRVMGAGNQWRTEMAVYAPPARDDEVRELLEAIRAEDPDVRRVEVIPPTATAIKRVQKRAKKLVRTGGARVPEFPDSGPTWGNTAKPQVGPESGVFRDPGNPRLPKKTITQDTIEEEDAVADAVGQGAGGFERAGSDAGAGGEDGPADGGSAASGTPNLPRQRHTSPRPRMTKTRPRAESDAFAIVRAAIPAAVAAPGTRLYAGLHRAINDLLNGAPGIPRRSPEQVVARINRRWYGEQADARSAPDYRGCDRCTPSGCDAPRRSVSTPDGCDRIRNRNSWLAEAIIAQDCPDPGCENGQIIGGGPCVACRERHARRRQADQDAAQAAAGAAAAWEAQTAAQSAARAVLDAWTAERDAEERRLRAVLQQTGVYGELLEHRVDQHITGWCRKHPRPTRQAVTS
jgi:hypothetical protein